MRLSVTGTSILGFLFVCLNLSACLHWPKEMHEQKCAVYREKLLNIELVNPDAEK